MKLSRNFYLEDDVVKIARNLIGKYLFTNIDGHLTGGIITETEAYAGVVDRASHAYNGRRTKRTEIMYSQGGAAYVYLCYGVHSLFNIVTNKQNIPHAVLIRGIQPTHGIDIMLKRAGKKSMAKGFGAGPGKVAKILGIHFSHTGIDLTGSVIWLEDRGFAINEHKIHRGPRIGIDYAGDDAKLPYRFWINL